MNALPDNSRKEIVMNKKSINWLSPIVVLLSFVFVLINGSAMAQGHKHDHIFSIGVGYLAHMFVEEDAFRKATGNYDGDEINALAGPEAYIEFFLGEKFSLGVKYQYAMGGVLYKVTNSASTGSAEVERIVTISNAMLYGNFSVPLGSSSWRMGVTAGTGSSTYNYRFECTKAEGLFACDDKFDESTNGVVTIAGFFADWGADGFGGRMGMSSVKTRYDEMPDLDDKEQTPEGNGVQVFVDLRYAF